MRDALAHIGGLPLNEHEGPITALAFSPDGRWLVTGSDDATARVWDMQNLTAAPTVLQGHESVITALAFSPDGRWLVTGSGDATARVWDMNLKKLVELACKTVGCNFTRAEWAQYFGEEPYRKTCEQWEEGK